MAIELVTYGKKKTVWKIFWNFLIEFNKTAINKDNIVEIGTVTNTIMKVFVKIYL